MDLLNNLIAKHILVLQVLQVIVQFSFLVVIDISAVRSDQQGSDHALNLLALDHRVLHLGGFFAY